MPMWSKALLFVVMVWHMGWASATPLSSGVGSGRSQQGWALRILLGYPPGGGGDHLLRTLAPGLGQALERAVVIDNRPGAAGLLAFQALMQSPADGRTLMLADSGLLNAAITQSPDLFLPANASPVAFLGTLPFILLVRTGLALDNIPNLLYALRKNPGTYSIATTGVGSMGHEAAELFQDLADVCLRTVPYKGGAQLLPDLAAGRVDMAMVSLTTAHMAVGSGYAHMVATTAAQRLSESPHVPALSEMWPGFEVVTHVFLLGPPGMEPEQTKTFEQAVVASLTPQIRASLDRQGLKVQPSGSVELKRRLQQQRRFLAEQEVRKSRHRGMGC
jgi:tripartite-type tricarboxylate transporter receptor subunit TctC